MDDAEIVESLDEQIGAAIRDAQATNEGNVMLRHLRTAEELLLNREGASHLIDNFLDEMLQFAHSNYATVKCFVASFIEKACKKDAEILKKTSFTLNFLLMSHGENNVAVMKKAMNVCMNLYPVVLRWAVGKKVEAEDIWEIVKSQKEYIMRQLDSENEGIRTMAIKFMETLVLAQSTRSEHSEGGAKGGMHLAEIPRDHRFMSYRQLSSEVQHGMDSLLNQTKLAHISSQNLLTVLAAICNIARQRPEFLSRVVDALDQLQVNLPPTLGTSQVKAVRKELKMHLIRLLKHPSSEPLTPKISSLLSDLGTSQAEIAKAIPESRKRAAARVDDSSQPAAKKSKDDFAAPSSNAASAAGPSVAADEEEEDEDEKREGDASMTSLEQEATDITAQFVFERLNHRIAANLALISLYTLPAEMPAVFQSSYTPIATAGTESQRQRLSRMMAAQMTQLDIGPGAETIRERRKKLFMERRSARSEGAIIPPTPAHVMKTDTDMPAKPRLPPTVTMPLPGPSAPAKSKQQFSLVSNTREMSAEERERLFDLSVKRIMNNERRAVQGGAAAAQQKLLVRLVSRFREAPSHLEKLLVDFVLAEQKARAELALLWVAELYAQYQGFSICVAGSHADGRFSVEERLQRYNRVLAMLLRTLYEREEHKELLFHKLLLEAPLITQDALSFLKLSCIDKVFGAFGTTTLRELVLTRARQRDDLLGLLFHLSFYEEPEVRLQAVDTVKELLELPYLRGTVCAHVERQLEECCLEQPPAHFLPEGTATGWNESIYRAALCIPMAAMAQQHSLIHPLARVFARASTEFKLVTIKGIDSAVKAIGMSSPEIPLLVESCPRGAESLVARVVILLTERTPATPELVVKLKKLHEERKTDVRSLLPVIPGLDREDIIRILPKFMLQASHVKSVTAVVKKILAAKKADSEKPTMSASDLLVEYHLIQPTTTEETETFFKNMDQIMGMKAMTRDVVSQAVEEIYKTQQPLPTLLFHSLTLIYEKFPMLDSFLSNILQKIISEHLAVSEEQKAAAYRAIAAMKSVAFAAVLTVMSPSELSDLISASPPEMPRQLRDFFPSLSSQLQRAISQEVLDLLGMQERPCDARESKRERERGRDGERERERERDRDGERRERRRR